MGLDSGPRMRWWRALTLFTFLLIAFVPRFVPQFRAVAASSRVGPVRAGICNCGSKPLSAKRLSALGEGLRAKTGFVGLRFDEAGNLVVNDAERIAGGSAQARALLLAALNGPDQFRLQDAHQSSRVSFAQISSLEVRLTAENQRSESWEIAIDFYDFAQLRGGSEAVAAFDPAINLLHELGHGVLGLQDDISASEPLGSCERYINGIRRELGLAQRANYRPQNRRVVLPDSTAQRVQAELTFIGVKRGLRDEKTRHHSLYFTVDNVTAPFPEETISTPRSARAQIP